VPDGACHELGAAIGKLHRLRCLHLHFFTDGRDYTALARGMAASGGCPELFEVCVVELERNTDSLTSEPSLIGPSVRRLNLDDVRGTEEEALVLCCGLVQMDYKHHLRIEMSHPDHGVLPRPLSDCLYASHSFRRWYECRVR
jgi:hypothetical protein